MVNPIKLLGDLVCVPIVRSAAALALQMQRATWYESEGQCHQTAHHSSHNLSKSLQSSV